MAGKKKRVIVTGGVGFIGSWLCDRLVEEDYSVICVDNIGSGRRKNIEHLLHSEKFEFIEQTLTRTKVTRNKLFDLRMPLPH